MAGRARTKALTELLATRSRLAFDVPEDQPAPSALTYVVSRIESGQTAKALCADLTNSLPFECDYGMLMRFLRAEHGGTNDEAESAIDSALRSARARASHCLAEESIEIVDEPAETMMDVSRAASRSRARQWAAQAWNKEDYGQQKGVSVTVTVGSLHLAALQAPPARATAIVTGSQQQLTDGEPEVTIGGD